MSKELNELSNRIIGAAMEVHKTTGPGLLESAYEEMLYYELKSMKLKVERQVNVPIAYKHLYIPKSYRLDLLVENAIIIELKSVKQLIDIHPKQLLTYLRLMDKKLGFVINFNVPLLKDGLIRVVNTYKSK